jgi:hypothetical protein
MSYTQKSKLSSQETALLLAYKHMTDDDQEDLVSYANACVRENPRKVVPHLSLFVSTHSSTPKKACDELIRVVKITTEKQKSAPSLRLIHDSRDA